MFPKSPQPELSHNCIQSHCCAHETARGESAAGNPASALPERPETKAEALWGSLKRYALWFLTFFGIYASSSVCVF